MKQKQKIIKIGNSAGVILPQDILKETGLKLGDNVAVDYNAQDKTAIIANENNKKAPSAITPEFYDWLNRFNKKYKKALTELAKK